MRQVQKGQPELAGYFPYTHDDFLGTKKGHNQCKTKTQCRLPRQKVLETAETIKIKHCSHYDTHYATHAFKLVEFHTRCFNTVYSVTLYPNLVFSTKYIQCRYSAGPGVNISNQCIIMYNPISRWCRYNVLKPVSQDERYGQAHFITRYHAQLSNNIFTNIQSRSTLIRLC